MSDSPATSSFGDKNQKRLFWACFFAIVATAFGFVIRGMILGDLQTAFNLTEAQKGEINGAGLWPFAISIILFSLIIDKIGYKTAMIFAFVAHLVSAGLTIFATGYTTLYWATFLCALANGTVEAVTNPVVATLFPREKTKWLNMLHAGWPGGLVLGGILTIGLGHASWQTKVALIILPVVLYGVMMLSCKFPISERVTAGVSYKDMLKEFGFVGALIVSLLMFSEIGRVFGFPPALTYGLVAVATIGFGAYVGGAPGHPLFIGLLLIMLPLATTELGTDGWITELMNPAMEKMGLAGGWVLVYTSLIMMILRFSAGSIVHRVSPIGLLLLSSAIALVGLFTLSITTGVTILVAATLYGFGKAFFWPTMLGIVAEQFPKGGALTLNATGGVGMLGVGIVGTVFLGYIQDTSVNKALLEKKPAVHQQVSMQSKWVFGEFQAIDGEKVKALPEADKAEIKTIQSEAKQKALQTVAIFPGIMLVGYSLVSLYFKSKGGYKAQHIGGGAEEPVQA